ncbi:MAG: signal peptidase I [bacterium]|nr:signal peptidase I [bacterium]
MIEKIKIKYNDIMEKDIVKFTIGFIKAVIAIFIVLIMALIMIQKFSNNNLSLGGYRLFTIVTGSMEPKYNVGDMVLAKEVKASDIEVYDDVVYNGKEDDFAGKIVAHQVIKKEMKNGKYSFVTKGIANPTEDPVISEDQIIGKIIYKTYVLSFISKIVNNVYGFYFLLFVPIVVLVFIEIIKIIEEKKEERMEKENNKKKDDEEEEL